MTSLQSAIKPKGDELSAFSQAIKSLTENIIPIGTFAVVNVALFILIRKGPQAKPQTTITRRYQVVRGGVVFGIVFGVNSILVALITKVQFTAFAIISAIGFSLLTAWVNDYLSNNKIDTKSEETEHDKTKKLLADKNAELAKKEEDRKRDLAEKDIELAEKKAQLEAADIQIKGLENQKRDLVERIGEVEVERDGKQKRLEAALAKLKTGEEGVESDAKNIIQLKTDAFKFQKALERANEKIKAEEGKSVALQVKLDEAEAKATANKKLLREAVEAKASQDEKVKTLEKKFEKVEKEKIKLEQENRELEKKIPGFFESLFNSSSSKPNHPSTAQDAHKESSEQQLASHPRSPIKTPTQGSDSTGTGSQDIGTTSEQDYSNPLKKNEQPSSNLGAVKSGLGGRGLLSVGFPGKNTSLKEKLLPGAVEAVTNEEIDGGSNDSSTRRWQKGQKKQGNITPGKNESKSTEGEAGSNQSPLPYTLSSVRTKTEQDTGSEKKPSSSGKQERRNSTEGY